MRVVIVDRKTKLRLLEARFSGPDLKIVTAREYVAEPASFARRSRVINLSRRYAYQDYGYYCSLLAEARGHRVIPTVEAILTLASGPLTRLVLSELDETLGRRINRLADAPESTFDIFIAFGQTDDPRFRRLARKAFDRIPFPLMLLRIERIERDGAWRVRAVRALASRDLNESRFNFFFSALERYLRIAWGRPAARIIYRYSLAILTSPREALPPSCPRALRRFVRAGQALGLEVDSIEPKDLLRLAEYDALFIRETTSISDHTYRAARRAEYEGMVVIDDPTSIVRCTNKVYLAELMAANGIPAPRTVVVEPDRLDVVQAALGYPMVVKVPDSAFSLGVHKVENRADLERRAEELSRRSDIIWPSSMSIRNTTGGSAFSPASHCSPVNTSCRESIGRYIGMERMGRLHRVDSQRSPSRMRRERS